MGAAAKGAALMGEACLPVKAMCEQYHELGYVSPFRLLSPTECERFLQAVAYESKETDGGWEKGRAANSRAFYEIATHPLMIEALTALLGDDVMLWGASIVKRVSGEVHPWHSDIESSAAGPGKTATAWIGLQNTKSESSLLLIPRSHRFGTTVQEMRYRAGKDRAGTTSEDVLGWARQRDGGSDLVKTAMADGEALLFDGQIWHGSRNLSGETRLALLLQYATPDVRIRIPDLNHLDWPFRYHRFAKARCVMVTGKTKSRVNRIVPAPAARRDSGDQLTSRVFPLQLPLSPDNEKGWRPYGIFEGHTAGLDFLSCHVSGLNRGCRPHPPHRHNEEEVLLLLAGEADLILPDEKAANGKERRRLQAGQLVYYPAQFAHTLETVSAQPANYLMFKWHSGDSDALSPLRFGQFAAPEAFEDQGADGFGLRPLFDGPTEYLQSLHCHVSTLAPGAGYDPHVDPYDVAIVVLAGEVETLKQRAAPNSVIFYRAGEPHGMCNRSETPARYIVFEFHSSQTGRGSDSLLSKVTDRRRVKRKLKRLARRFVREWRSRVSAGNAYP